MSAERSSETVQRPVVEDRFQRAAVEFAASIGARIVLPTDHKRPIDLFRTDVEATWDRFRPELPF